MTGENLLRDPSAFIESLAGKRVALVGPAASLTGRGLGAAIDEHDVIVRMNLSYERDASLAIDYGSRTDVLYHILAYPGRRPIEPADVESMRADGVDWLVSKWGPDTKNRGRLAALVSIAPPELLCSYIPSPFAGGIRGELRSEPHTGLLTARHLLSSDLASLSVFGCDFYASGYQDGYGGLSHEMITSITEHAAQSERGEVTWLSGGYAGHVDREPQMRMLARLLASDDRLRLDDPTLARIQPYIDRLVTALVPMKGHSVRLPGKNIRPMLDRPLCWYVLDTLSRSAVDRIVVDTDSEAIADVVDRLFPHVTVLDRPQHLRGPEVNGNPLTEWEMSQATGEHFLQTHVTNPLLTVETVNRAIDTYFNSLEEHDSLFAVTEHRSHFYDAQGAPLNHDPADVRPTQDLPALFEDNHCLYVFSRASFAAAGGRIGARPQMFPLPRLEAVDIDYEDDFRLAAVLMEQRMAEERKRPAAGRRKEIEMGCVVYSTNRTKNGAYAIRGAVDGVNKVVTVLLGDNPTLADAANALRNPEQYQAVAETAGAPAGPPGSDGTPIPPVQATGGDERAAAAAELLALDAKSVIASVPDVEPSGLAYLREAEAADKHRTTVLRAIDERIAAVAETAGAPA